MSYSSPESLACVCLVEALRARNPQGPQLPRYTASIVDNVHHGSEDCIPRAYSCIPFGNLEEAVFSTNAPYDYVSVLERPYPRPAHEAFVVTCPRNVDKSTPNGRTEHVITIMEQSFGVSMDALSGKELFVSRERKVGRKWIRTHKFVLEARPERVTGWLRAWLENGDAERGISLVREGALIEVLASGDLDHTAPRVSPPTPNRSPVTGLLTPPTTPATPRLPRRLLVAPPYSPTEISAFRISLPPPYQASTPVSATTGNRARKVKSRDQKVKALARHSFKNRVVGVRDTVKRRMHNAEKSLEARLGMFLGAKSKGYIRRGAASLAGAGVMMGVKLGVPYGLIRFEELSSLCTGHFTVLATEGAVAAGATAAGLLVQQAARSVLSGDVPFLPSAGELGVNTALSAIAPAYGHYMPFVVESTRSAIRAMSVLYSPIRPVVHFCVPSTTVRKWTAWGARSIARYGETSLLRFGRARRADPTCLAVDVLKEAEARRVEAREDREAGTLTAGAWTPQSP